jgi:hypothetical protein
MFLNGKSQYYPLKNIVGASFCYCHDYAILWFGMYTQFSSLFISIYRYICLFSGKTLIHLNISPKVRNTFDFGILFQKLIRPSVRKNLWNSRLKAEKLKNIWITRSIYSNSENSEQFLKQNTFLTYSGRFLRSNTF